PRAGEYGYLLAGPNRCACASTAPGGIAKRGGRGFGSGGGQGRSVMGSNSLLTSSCLASCRASTPFFARRRGWHAEVGCSRLPQGFKRDRKSEASDLRASSPAMTGKEAANARLTSRSPAPRRDGPAP